MHKVGAYGLGASLGESQLTARQAGAQARGLDGSHSTSGHDLNTMADLIRDE
jgi:hypothetical protein